MSIRRKTLTLSILFILVQQAWAADTQVVSTLVDQGRYWQNHSRSDLAVESWQKLLRLDPSQPDALYGMGISELDKNNGEGARTWLAKLKELQPRHPLKARLEEAIATRTGAQPIEFTRKPTQISGKDEFARRYREQPAEKTVQLDKPPARENGPSAPTPAIGLNIQQGFNSINSGELELATAKFEAVLKVRPADTNALGGLGLIRLRQNRFGEAQQLLERASKQGHAEQWRGALKSATYWGLLQKANTARQASDIPLAQKLLEQAMKVDPQEVTAQIALAEVRGELKQYDSAEKLLRDVLTRQPKQTAAIAAYADLLAKQDKFEQAQLVLNQLTPQQRDQLGGLGRIQVESMRKHASSLQAAGDLNGARNALEDAMSYDPSNVWVRLDLGRLYIMTGQTNEARSIVDGLLLAGPDQSDAMYAAALLTAENQDWNRSQQILERIPTAARNKDIAALMKRVSLHNQIDQIMELARQGQRDQANAQLRQLEQTSDHTDETMGALASAYAETGDAGRAMAIMRPMVARRRNDTSLMLQYASVLLNTRQDAEFSTVMRQLREKNLSSQDAKNYSELNVAFVLRRVDVERENNNLATAYDLLAPLMMQRPDDPRLLSSMARLYAASGEHKQALVWYDRALDRKPKDLELLLSALSAAVDAKAFNEAQTLVERAAGVDGNSVRVLTAWARLYRAEGKNSKAEEYYRAALVAENRGRPSRLGNLGNASGAGVAQQPQSDNNPFRRNASELVPLRSTDRTTQAEQPASFAFASYTQPDVAPLQPRPRALPATQASGFIKTAYVLPESNNNDTLPLQQDFYGENRNALPYVSRVLPPAELISQTSNTGTRPPALTDNLHKEAAEFSQQRSSNVTGQLGAIVHSGENGLGKLTEIYSTLEANIKAGDGHITVSAAPVSLDAGTLSADYNTASRFGSGPAAALANSTGTSGVRSQTASGVGLALGYTGDTWTTDIGSTPLGFLYTNAVGGLQFRTPISDQVKMSVGVSRRAVTESLISFAGTRDDRTGVSWGGVTANSLRADLGWDVQGNGVYVFGLAQSLQGHNVASNTALQAGGGVYLSLVKEADTSVTTGVSATTMSYNKNLGNMTYGNGGYFSPQSFYALSLPVTMSGTNGRLGYQLRGSLGVQNFKEDSAPYFPTNGTLQAAAVAAAAQAAGRNSNNSALATFLGTSKTALTYSFGAALEYLVTPQLTLGSALEINNGRDYRQWNSSIYLRFVLDSLTNGKVSAPVLPHSPYSVNN